MARALHKIFGFPGGIHVPGKKEMSTQSPIQLAPLPDQVILPLQQHIGGAAEPIVEVGDSVQRGQVVARASGFVSAPVHATISGHVAAIGEFPIAHPSGLTNTCIVIHSDGKDSAIAPTPILNWRDEDPSHLRNLIREAGIVGLGGAAFPSFIKLNPGPGKKIDTFIVNGAECEPYISCDDMLMRERADGIFAGIDIVMHAIQAKHCLIGIEDNKPEAIAAMTEALAATGREDIDVITLPTRYPQGGEKQLIQTLTGKEVPSNGLPLDIGIVCHNPGTLFAIQDAVLNGNPLTSRVMTVTGEGIEHPQNYDVRIGTPVRDLTDAAGGYSREISRLIMGGPMMGFALRSDKVPVVKATNCILAEPNTVEDTEAMPCIRCGECAEVCPAKLLPQQMYWHAKAKDFDKVQDYKLFDCIECGACAQVCPSHIPLVQYYRFAKSEIWALEVEQRQADTARDRHEFRQERLEKAEAEKKARADARKAALRAKKEAEAAQAAEDAASDTGQKDKNTEIAEAIARNKAAKEANQTTAATEPNITDDVKPQPQALATTPVAKRQAAASELAANAIAHAQSKAGIEAAPRMANPTAETTAPAASQIQPLSGLGSDAAKAAIEKAQSAAGIEAIVSPAPITNTATTDTAATSTDSSTSAGTEEAKAAINAARQASGLPALSTASHSGTRPTTSQSVGTAASSATNTSVVKAEPDVPASIVLAVAEYLQRKGFDTDSSQSQRLIAEATAQAIASAEQQLSQTRDKAQGVAQPNDSAGFTPSPDAIACPPLAVIERFQYQRAIARGDIAPPAATSGNSGLPLSKEALACPPLAMIERFQAKRNGWQLGIVQDGYTPSADAVKCPPLQHIERLQLKRSGGLVNAAATALSEEAQICPPLARIEYFQQQRASGKPTARMATVVTPSPSKVSTKVVAIEATEPVTSTAFDPEKQAKRVAARAAILKAQQASGIEAIARN